MWAILLGVVVGFVAMAAASAGVGAMLGVGAVSVAGGVALMCLELFVAFLQAYLFTFLTTLFISQMVAHHGDHGHEEHGHEGHGAHH